MKKRCECCNEILEDDEKKFCSEECAEIYYCPEPNKPATKAKVIRMGTDIDGKLYIAE